MPKMYTDANPSMIAYCIEDGISNYTRIPRGHSSMEAEYIAIVFGLSEYFRRWNTELDARHGDLDAERLKATGEIAFADVASPADKTPRPLPPPLLVLCDNEVVVRQLNREYHVRNNRLRKLAQQVWQMIQNVEVQFQWISRKDNPAGKMLK